MPSGSVTDDWGPPILPKLRTVDPADGGLRVLDERNVRIGVTCEAFCIGAHIGFDPSPCPTRDSTIWRSLKVSRGGFVRWNVPHARKPTVLLLLAVAGCGVAERDEVSAAEDDEVPIILHGRETAADPAVVKVQRHHGLGGLGVCTGTLIAPRYVLTARHCTGSGRLEVLVGDGARPARIAVTRTHLDRPTGPTQSSGDIAVLELATAASVAPLPVNLDAAKVGALEGARVVGFGLTGARVEDERKRTVEFASRTTREFVESQRAGVVCYGDSGGPTLGIIDGHEQIVAVTSHMTSTRCSKGRVRSVRTDRHRAFLTAFIDVRSVPEPQAKVEPPPPPVVVPTPPAPVPIPVPSMPQAKVEPRPPAPRAKPRPVWIDPPPPLPPPPMPPRTVTASNGSAHASASSTGGRTRVSVRVDGTGAHAEAHASP